MAALSFAPQVDTEPALLFDTVAPSVKLAFTATSKEALRARPALLDDTAAKPGKVFSNARAPAALAAFALQEVSRLGRAAAPEVSSTTK